ncbi:MBL fold metallo-hydrolase [Rhodobacteraceae bacterium RKSG542]|uniref:MBL fold metallo-hydrolase n=1 Tax=Pseudovibrio flavus TaxID=2529854 RepID=UPI0012BB78C8|nr:MBL fold metallo-hydrolase [Pseudovibrio flavus]MTI19051.1 MBL fold metallo-hydrolase [Pseudovibrio flavus]
MSRSDESTKHELQVTVVPVTPFQQNCAILYSPVTKKGAVVDPGGDADIILEAIANNGLEIEKILITHGHIDHIGAAADLSERLGVPIIGPHEDEKSLIDGVGKQAKQFGLPNVRSFTPDQWLNEGDTVDVAGVEFQVLHCPGHSPGHVVFYTPELKFAVVGDVLFAGSIGRTDLPGGDYATLISSIKDKLLPLGDDITFLPGHGSASTFGDERKSNPFLK